MSEAQQQAGRRGCRERLHALTSHVARVCLCRRATEIGFRKVGETGGWLLLSQGAACATGCPAAVVFMLGRPLRMPAMQYR